MELVIENIAFSGGGIKSLAFCGAIRVLEKKEIMKGVKRIIGTSAGSIFAFFVACGFNSYELIEIINRLDFAYLKKNGTLIENIYRFIFNYGFYCLNLFMSWISDALEGREIDPEITFEEVYQKFGKEIIITGTNLNRKEIVYFNRESTPNMPVKDAVRISISIPLFFEPVKMDEDIYVDGGVLCNYPIGYFESFDPDLQKTIGFNVMSSCEIMPRREINDILHVIEMVFATLTIKTDTMTITEKQKGRTIRINTKDVNATDFHIKKEVKDRLFGRGYRQTKKFLMSLSEKSIKN